MIELTLIIIYLLQQLSCQMILLNETNLSQKDIYQFDNFIPQGFYLKIGEVILFSLSSLDNSENQPIMELCTDQYKANCVIDHNAIDFKLKVQNVRIVNQANISNSYKTQYNAIPFSSNVYLDIRSNNSFNLMAQITKYQNCPQYKFVISQAIVKMEEFVAKAYVFALKITFLMIVLLWANQYQKLQH